MVIELPQEIWNIIMDFKKRIEYRDDCILDTKYMKLRSGKQVWNNTTRINKFMNEVNYLCHNLEGLSVITIEGLCSLIKNYYYFIKTIGNLETKERISKIVLAIETKVDKFNYELELYIRGVIKMNIDERNYSLDRISEVRYFIKHFNCIVNNKDNCKSHLLSFRNSNKKSITCNDFKDWCN